MVSIQQIVELNNIQNPNLIYPGEQLRITSLSTNGVLQNNYTNPNTPANYIVYTVRSGDTLWAISRYYGVSINRIVTINHIQNPNLIYPGQILYI